MSDKEAEAVLRAMSSDTPVRMPTNTAVKPKHALALLVGYGKIGSHRRRYGLDLGYSGMKLIKLETPDQPDTQLAEICAKIEAGTIDWEKPKYGAKMGSGLSIGIAKSATIILAMEADTRARYRTLVPPATEAPPFMSGSLEGSARHYNPRHYCNGRLLPAGSNLASADPDCRIAMFTVDHSSYSGTAAKTLPFNIYLEVVGRTDDGQTYITPIIIDPDTRYPPSDGGVGGGGGVP